jgi:hypothetical protein
MYCNALLNFFKETSTDVWVENAIQIVGSQVKINPLIVILGVIIGEMLWGISGMFLSIPYLAIAKVIFDRAEGLEPWGILLGEEEHTPKKVKRLIKKVKEKEA